MVTDKELEDMVKKLYKDRQKEPLLSERTDEELMKIAQEAKKEKRFLRENLAEIWEKYWNLKEKIGKIDSLQKNALTIKGTRKGRYCLAKKQGDHYGGYTECEARKGWQHFYDDNELYRKYCSTCCLKQKTIEKRLTFKRIFESKKVKD